MSELDLQSNQEDKSTTAQATIADSIPHIQAYPVLETKENIPKLRKWAHNFCDICYTDKERSNKCFPYCFPFAWPCSCVSEYL